MSDSAEWVGSFCYLNQGIYKNKKKKKVVTLWDKWSACMSTVFVYEVIYKKKIIYLAFLKNWSISTILTL